MKSFFYKNGKIFPPYVYIFILFLISVIITMAYFIITLQGETFIDYKFVLGILGFVDIWLAVFYKWGNGHKKDYIPPSEDKEQIPIIESENN